MKSDRWPVPLGLALAFFLSGTLWFLIWMIIDFMVHL